MLIAITLTLAPTKPGTLPPYVGRANYAATLNRIRQLDPELSAEIHDCEGPKPLTCSSLLQNAPPRAGIPLQLDREYRVRVTGLTEPVSVALHTGLIESPPATWELDGHLFRVVATLCDSTQDGWTGQTAFETLAAQQMQQGAARRVTLRFASPTSFKSGGMHVPVPMPGLVFGSLVERWNRFSPVALSPDMRRFGAEMVAVSRYRLESRAVDQKSAGNKQALRMGGVGEATYVALGGDRYWAGVMQMLAEFARYSGVGVQTATGMGQARRVG